MIIRKTTTADLPVVMPIYEEARVSIGALGIDQWQDGYPAEADIAADIANGEAWCVELDGEIVGTFAFLLGGEPDYDVIENGAWLTDSDSTAAKYATIHRIAVSGARRGCGISTAIVNFTKERAAENGMVSVRVDTHFGNVVMRRMVEKHGFKECGTIYLANGDPRVGYEYVI